MQPEEGLVGHLFGIQRQEDGVQVAGGDLGLGDQPEVFIHNYLRNPSNY